MKRKGDSASMGQGGGIGDGDGDGATANRTFTRADASTMLDRRTVAARDGDGKKKRSVNSRRREYMKKLRSLNKSFAAWAEQQLSRGEIHEGLFYFDAGRKYLREAEALKRRYMPDVGDVVVFGSGDCGQLALDDSEDGSSYASPRPRLAHGLEGKGIASVGCGGLHNVAATDRGAVYTWGCNDEGSLGSVLAPDTAYLPIRVTGFKPSAHGPDGTVVDPALADIPFERREEESILAVAAGDVQTVFLAEGGNVYFCGAYKDKEGKIFRDVQPPDDTRAKTSKDLESDEHADQFLPPRGKQEFPIHVNKLPRNQVREIGCGYSYNAVVLKDNVTVMTWGIGECGELARGDMPPIRYDVPESHPNHGKYDMETVLNRYLTPGVVRYASPPPNPSIKRKVVDVSCGGYHFHVLAEEGPAGIRAYSSGHNNYGQLGLGDLNSRDKLTKIDALDTYDITKITSGEHHSLCVDATGKCLWAWGRGDKGALGTTDDQPGAYYNEESPVRVALVHGDGTTDGEGNIDDDTQPEVKQIAAGGSHNLVVTTDNEVYSWGFGEMDQLGHGKRKDEYRPRKIDVEEAEPGAALAAGRDEEDNEIEYELNEERQDNDPTAAKKPRLTEAQKDKKREEFQKKKAKRKMEARAAAKEAMAGTTRYVACGAQHSVLIVTHNRS